MYIRRIYGIVTLIILVSVLLSGCMFGKLKEEMEEFEETWYIIGGFLTNQSPHQKEVVVVAYEDTPGKKVAVKALSLIHI